LSQASIEDLFPFLNVQVTWRYANLTRRNSPRPPAAAPASAPRRACVAHDELDAGDEGVRQLDREVGIRLALAPETDVLLVRTIELESDVELLAPVPVLVDDVLVNLVARRIEHHLDREQRVLAAVGHRAVGEIDGRLDRVHHRVHDRAALQMPELLATALETFDCYACVQRHG